jgi:N-acyl-D-amino-acid deacylase
MTRAVLLLALSVGAQEPPLRSLDDAMEAHLRDLKTPGGALAVAKDGRLLYAKGFGKADLEKDAPVAAAALFRIASISKPLTAVAVLDLAEQGKLDLDARAFVLLGLKPTGDPRLETVTVRQLLQHTAGWDRGKSGDAMFRSVEIAAALGMDAPADAAAVIKFMVGQPLDFDPGTRYAYSNLGYCILGRLIEKVTGEPYEAYVKRAVLAPMGITRMRLGRSLFEERAADEVRYYQRDLKPRDSVFSKVKGEVAFPYGGFCIEAMDAHGGWLASAVDLVKFGSRLDRVLEPKSVEAMFAAPPVLKQAAVHYGCGWQVRRVEGKGFNTWHTGSLPGTSTLLVRRHDGFVWAALFNERGPQSGRIDGALHGAADAVGKWPDGDLFGSFP